MRSTLRSAGVSAQREKLVRESFLVVDTETGVNTAYDQIYTDCCDLDMTGETLSSDFDMLIERGTPTSNSYAGDIIIKYVDAHIVYDTIGSREEASK